MKKEEKDYLSKIKKSQGKCSSVVNKEINDLEISLRSFKILNKELKKKETIIKNRDKKIILLELRIQKLKNKDVPLLFSKEKNSAREIFLKDIEKETEKVLSVKREKYYRRAENNLEVGRDYTKDDIKSEFMIHPNYISWVIKTLIEREFLEGRLVGGIRRYKKL